MYVHTYVHTCIRYTHTHTHARAHTHTGVRSRKGDQHEIGAKLAAANEAYAALEEWLRLPGMSLICHMSHVCQAGSRKRGLCGAGGVVAAANRRQDGAKSTFLASFFLMSFFLCRRYTRALAFEYF
jgi:hypothetical protein